MSKSQAAPHSTDLTPLLAEWGIDAAKVDQALLQLAFIDISSSPEENNEKLEFLGDAALRLAAAEFLGEAYPHMPLGEMAAVRSHIVSDRVLAIIAQQYHFSRYLILSKSAAGDKAGKNSRLADTAEAVIGALYLSTGNLSLIRPWLDSHFQQFTQALRSDPARQNYKAALQELTQSHYKALPTYHVTEISQIHGDEERFQAVVWFQDKPWGDGKGRSRKIAQQAAAKVAFAELQQAIKQQTAERAS